MRYTTSWRALLPCSSSRLLPLQQRGDVRPRPLGTFPNLNQHAFIQFELVPILNFGVTAPMMVPDEVTGKVVDHDALVEGVVSEKAILVAFRLASNVERVETLELEDRWCGVLLSCCSWSSGGSCCIKRSTAWRDGR